MGGQLHLIIIKTWPNDLGKCMKETLDLLYTSESFKCLLPHDYSYLSCLLGSTCRQLGHKSYEDYETTCWPHLTILVTVSSFGFI